MPGFLFSALSAESENHFGGSSSIPGMVQNDLPRGSSAVFPERRARCRSRHLQLHQGICPVVNRYPPCASHSVVHHLSPYWNARSCPPEVYSRRHMGPTRRLDESAPQHFLGT